ncbi:MAG TPA: hypothetical protein VN540_03440 [Clostridia bacterium]|nr:hypothetical protein [Clostridia bacterium]
MESKYYPDITSELLEQLKIEVMLREDELAIETDKSLETAGALNDPDLCEIASEVEDFAIKVEALEKQLGQFDAGVGE